MSQTHKRSTGSAKGTEWGKGEISRGHTHQAQVTAPRSMTTEVENPKRTDEMKRRRASAKPHGSRVRQKNTQKGVEGDERRGKEPRGQAAQRVEVNRRGRGRRELIIAEKPKHESPYTRRTRKMCKLYKTHGKRKGNSKKY